MIENNGYREKLLNAFSKEFIVGNSKTQLLELKEFIDNQQCEYMEKYETYVKEVEGLIQKEYNCTSSDEDVMIAEKLKTREAFNRFSNEQLGTSN